MADNFWEDLFSDTKNYIKNSTPKSILPKLYKPHFLIQGSIYFFIAIIGPVLTKRPGSIKATFVTLVLVGIGLFAAWLYKKKVEMNEEDEK